MKCKHGKTCSKCNKCSNTSDETSKYLIRSNSSLKCYTNAFILLPNASSTVVRNFTQEEITDQLSCHTVPLTSSCNGSYLQISKCKAPKDKWCKVIDQANEYITSIQVPECCQGCYNFDLSASVALTATISFTLGETGATPVRLVDLDINLPVKADLKLSEQLPRDVCVADEVADRPESCFTSVTFPILDTPMASAILAPPTLGTLFLLPGLLNAVINVPIFEGLAKQDPNFVNLSVSGLVCLKACQRLVPTLTIAPFNFDVLSQLIIRALTTFNIVPVLNIRLTNIKLRLAALSLKLVKVGDCDRDCDCRKR